jgi:hypothetical protein
MTVPESSPHIALKELLVTKLKAWCGASIDEYPSSGHELDVFAVSSSGVSIYIEVIWSPSRAQFDRDMSMLQQSDADVKLAVVHPDIIAKRQMVRDFHKIVLSQRKQGKTIHGDLLDGQTILEDPEYVDHDLRNLLEQLVTQAQTRPGETEKLSDIPILQVWKSNLASNAAALMDRQRMFEKLIVDDRPLDSLAVKYPQLVNCMADVRAQIAELNRNIESYDSVARSRIEYLQMPTRFVNPSMSLHEVEELKKSRELKAWAQDSARTIDLRRKKVLTLVKNLMSLIDQLFQEMS